MERLKQELLACLGEEGLKLHEMMKEHTTFRVGGAADYFIQPKSAEELRAAFEILHRYEMPVLVIGNGSNLLVRDKGIRGAVIQIYNRMAEITIEGNTIHTKGGALLSAVAARAADKGLTGLEFASGIPGSIGGAVVMNAGAYGGELKQVVTEATVMTKDGMILHVPAEQMALGHRLSSFMQTGEIILSVKMQLTQGNPVVIKETMDDFNSRRREKQPLEYPSAGSTFKRPAGYFAGKLIEDAGLKGFSVGGAQVSKKHAGFVINTGSATAADIWNLCNEIQNRVQNEFGVTLEMEIQKLGSFEQQKTKG